MGLLTLWRIFTVYSQMKKRIIAIIMALACGVGSLYAQNVVKNENFITVNGMKMYLHKIRPGETIEAIAKAYNTTVQIISMHNQERQGKGKMPVTIAVRPEEFTMHMDGEGLDAVVNYSVFLGISTHYFVTTAEGQELEVIRPSDVGKIIPNGSAVKLRVETERINVFTEDGMHTLIRQTEDIDGNRIGGEGL